MESKVRLDAEAITWCILSIVVSCALPVYIFFLTDTGTFGFIMQVFLSVVMVGSYTALLCGQRLGFDILIAVMSVHMVIALASINFITILVGVIHLWLAWSILNHVWNKPDIASSDISTGEWIVTMAVLCIPVMGLVMAIVGAFTSAKLSKANFLKAYLIVAAFAVAIAAVFARPQAIYIFNYLGRIFLNK